MRRACLGLLFVASLPAQVRVVGKVADENQLPVPSARISLGPQAALSDPAGAFSLTLPQPGDYLVTVQREGFFVLRDRPISLRPGDNHLTLLLNHLREVHESIEVTWSPPAVNPDQTASSHQILSTEILGIPYPSTNDLRNALALLPGILQDSTGRLHLQGGGSDQTLWLLDGFNLTDPLTGRFESRLSVEGIQSMEVDSSRYSADTGKGSAGAVRLHPLMGDDRWRPAATNFVPSVEQHKGLLLANWTPRFTLAGPLRRGRVWLSDAAFVRYDKNVVDELPSGLDRNTIWRTSNLLRLQANLTPANILTASWLWNDWRSPHDGLTLLDPLETTVHRSTRQNFLSFKDQLYFSSRALLEVGYAATRNWARESPQGLSTYVFTPEGRSGNYFLDARRRSSRDQWLASLYFSRGPHHLQAGLDLDRLTYYQNSTRHPYEFYRSNLTLSRRVQFAGNPLLRRHNFETSAYLQDRWKLASFLLLEAGLRSDWDQIIRQPAVSPRLSLAFSPPRLPNTKLSAGFGLFRDAPNLRVLSRHLDQYTLAQYYSPDGLTLTSGPAAGIYLLDDRLLRLPTYRNLSFGFEHLLPRGLHARLEYLRKRGRDGFTFVGLPAAGFSLPPGATQFEGIYFLSNLRRDQYDSLELTLRKTFHRQSEILASYTRSRAQSNAVVDVNIDDPLLVADNEGRLPWDSPHRLLNWGLLALSDRYSLAWLFEARTGYPFNIVDDDGRLQGLNVRRYPAYLNLNLHLERKITLWGHRWALRAGFNNLSNRLNPTVVNNNASSPRFLHFSGGQHRAFVLRLRWLAKAAPEPRP